MKPLHEHIGYQTIDLTECKVHFKDGRLVVFKPKKWEKLHSDELPLLKGGKFTVTSYLVTEWEEIPINAEV